MGSKAYSSNEFTWTCGGNSRLSYKRPVGTGGFGEVYEIYNKRTREVHPQKLLTEYFKSFARKIVVVSHRIPEADIQNETQVITALRTAGGHENIIKFLDHGWLRGRFSAYFIDMELGDCTLADYIDHFRGTESRINFDDIEISRPSFVRKDCTFQEKLQNLWSIGLQIARGLEFMHSHKYVHRDLKPSNVLYCQKSKLWKLSDFGISSTATSKVARPTHYSRGTSSYRAPELLRAEPTFNNKVDIWSLGCVLHELATFKVAFCDDWVVLQYGHEADTRLAIKIDPTKSEFLEYHLCENIHELLHRSPSHRPRASMLVHRFSFYSRLLEVEQLQDIQSYPSYIESYTEWKAYADRQDYEALLLRISEVCGEAQPNLSLNLKKELIKIYISDTTLFPSRAGKKNKQTNSNAPTMLQEIAIKLEELGRTKEAIVVYEELLRENPVKLCVRRHLAHLYFEIDSVNERAIQLYEDRLDAEPRSFWTWRDLCEIYLLTQDYDAAIEACKRGMKKSPQNSAPAMVLSKLYASRGEFESAISAYIGLWDVATQSNHVMAKQSVISALTGHTADLEGLSVNVNDPDIVPGLEQLENAANPNLVKAWLSSYPCFETLLDNETIESTFRFAAWSGNVQKITQMVNDNQIIYTPDPQGWHGLHLAIWNMHTEVVEILLGCQEVGKELSKVGPMPLQLAAWNDDDKIINLLLEKCKTLRSLDFGFNSVHWAASNGSMKAITLLKRAGIEVNGRDQTGRTAIHSAARHGAVEVITTLGHWGGDVSAPDAYGWTPLHEAACNGHDRAIRELHFLKTDLRAQTHDGQTAMHLALRNGHSEAISTLREYGSSVAVG